MINIQKARINTAGAYVCINGFYVFALGIRPHNGYIPVVRLGGHRQENETAWQCAIREVHEEANVQIRPVLPTSTYLYDCDHLEKEFQEIPWQHEPEGKPAPILVGAYCREDGLSLSLMYLAQADGLPTPSSEVKGLVLLGEAEIHHLCRGPMTLEQYLNRGGKAILSGDFDMKRVLEPFTQLRLLSRTLSMQPKTRTI